jgi:hypothetical protein
MKTIEIGFTKPKKKFPIISWLIRLVQSTPFSHVYLSWYSQYLDRKIIYQASGTQVHFVSEKIFNKTQENVAVFKLKIEDDEYKKLVQFAIDEAGAAYGIKQLIGIGYVEIARYLGFNKKNPFADGKNSYVCSELVVRALCGIPSVCAMIDAKLIDKDKVTPKDVYHFMEDLARLDKDRVVKLP